MRKLLVAGCLLLLGCADPFGSGNQQAQDSILAHGGLEAFTSINSIRVIKTIRLFEEAGTLESETTQFQVLRTAAGAGSSVGWKSKFGLVRVTDHGGELQYTLNDSLHIGPQWDEKVRSTIDGAKFVLFQPFKLAKDDIELQEVGERQLAGFGTVKIYQLHFPEPTQDTWYFYFDQQQRLVANEVVHNGRRSLIENLEFQEHQGLLLHKHRKSYYVDSLHQQRVLRAEYFYDYRQ